MGNGSWDRVVYDTETANRKATGTKAFAYDDAVRRGQASGIHPDLDPSKVAGPTSPFAGKPIRESRDSDEHPESLPIAMLFDVTGSMGRIPTILQEKLPRLMDVIIERTMIRDPQILIGAIGDSTCDHFPFQVGQFESDNRFDEQLRKLILEGGGGGQVRESYALAYRFAAYHTATDAMEKRGRKGYLFTMGDEAPWPTVGTRDVSRIFGVSAEADETIEELILKASEKWDIFHLFSEDGSYPDLPDIRNRWKELLGERFIPVKDSSLVCEIIAGIINMMEKAHGVKNTINDLGLSGKAAQVVGNALANVSTGHVVGKIALGKPPEALNRG